MTKTRPSYTTEFKQEAASLVLDKDYAITEACKAMRVGNTAMQNVVESHQ
ncbi:hypothetical protein MNBD_GAMMA22-2985 [hydrothermal vent metagenome]|uniref:Transposase n=1 Tax=hydrothermal vent metagenome TaxID=652676 RepID=A0A3B1B635_9ZZZZ